MSETLTATLRVARYEDVPTEGLELARRAEAILAARGVREGDRGYRDAYLEALCQAEQEDAPYEAHARMARLRAPGRAWGR